MIYGVYGLVASADIDGKIKPNKKTLIYIGCFLSIFLGFIIIAFATHMHKKQYKEQLQMVERCGEIVGYYPNDSKQILTRQTKRTSRGGSYEIRYTLTLKIDGKQDYMFSLPDNFQKIPIGFWACFEIQDGSQTFGAYKSQIVRTMRIEKVKP